MLDLKLDLVPATNPFYFSFPQPSDGPEQPLQAPWGSFLATVDRIHVVVHCLVSLLAAASYWLRFFPGGSGPDPRGVGVPGVAPSSGRLLADEAEGGESLTVEGALGFFPGSCGSDPCGAGVPGVAPSSGPLLDDEAEDGVPDGLRVLHAAVDAKGALLHPMENAMIVPASNPWVY